MNKKLTITIEDGDVGLIVSVESNDKDILDKIENESDSNLSEYEHFIKKILSTISDESDTVESYSSREEFEELRNTLEKLGNVEVMGLDDLLEELKEELKGNMGGSKPALEEDDSYKYYPEFKDKKGPVQ